MIEVELLDEVLLDSQNRGFIGPGSVASHRRHAEAFVAAIGPGASQGVDLGTGGGLPGLVLAAAVTSVHWTFVESSVKRADFLVAAAGRLGLDVTVLPDRAEVVGRSALRGTIDVVTARSFGAPAVVAECAAPLLVSGGRLIVSEPPEADGADRWPSDRLAELGLGPVRIVPGPPRLAVIEQIGHCPDDAPRKVGLPAKRPRF